jgi:GTPase involved in cell partitioning and DNA repair
MSEVAGELLHAEQSENVADRIRLLKIEVAELKKSIIEKDNALELNKLEKRTLEIELRVEREICDKRTWERDRAIAKLGNEKN